MAAISINHVAISAQNWEETIAFYERVFGMERIPTYNFGFPSQYLRCGDLQLHIFKLENPVPPRQHFALDVDDFHAVYDAAEQLGAINENSILHPIIELPDGSVQMFLKDPAGNVVEVDWPDASTLDRSRVPGIKPLSEFACQKGDSLKASLYFDRPQLRSNVAVDTKP